ncbi:MULTISPECIES: hypothetical protein [unclassified Pedobacter]|uniref:hypothetical protein n=1 Tax=unclassified Pedobacter TaxID=2628915 RepID=UPI001DA190C7|nr:MULTISPECIES: hypothetical protein [unclassified Pedobacter]CAH0186147.1 hypothetical protein SRABI36_01632 [Pedobacter sp. Bi36]CAH0241907.1 hypothetical protein SRABI126_02725 [Pedobacter sp. Bi126]
MVTKHIITNDSADKFSTVKLPFIYQSEFYSIAWGTEHYGFFIDPQGRKYNYRLSKDYRYAITDKWKWCTPTGMVDPMQKTVYEPEEDGEITPAELFENLTNSVEYKPWFGYKKKTNIITEEMIADLLQSPIEDHEDIACDAGSFTNSLYVYDAEIDIYKRILLSMDGDIKKINQSIYTYRILSQFGTQMLRYNI